MASLWIGCLCVYALHISDPSICGHPGAPVIGRVHRSDLSPIFQLRSIEATGSVCAHGRLCYPPITLLSPSYHPPITLLSPSYHPPITLLSLSYHPSITLLSPSYHPPTTLLSPSYHPLIALLSPSYHPPITLLSLSYHPPITFISPSYRSPITLLSPSYHSPITLLSNVILYHSPNVHRTAAIKLRNMPSVHLSECTPYCTSSCVRHRRKLMC